MSYGECFHDCYTRLDCPSVDPEWACSSACMFHCIGKVSWGTKCYSSFKRTNFMNKCGHRKSQNS
jgi:hypothetical protein